MQAEDFINAKEALLAFVAKQQKELTGVRKAKSELTSSYESALQKLENYRGQKLWYPYLGKGIGNGPFVALLDGSVKYDFIGGIGVHHFGHSHPEILSSCIDAALNDIVMQGHLQQNADQLELMELLVQESNMDHCFLTTTGSMANENALKIAFQKNFPAKRILAFERGFAGRTLAMSQITEKPEIRDGLPYQLGIDYIPFFDYREPEKSKNLAVDCLKRHLWRHPKDHALMLFELIQGEGGFYPGTADFFRAIMEILKDNEIAIAVDEVQTFGRTSKLFAYQHFELSDLVDIVTIGKLAQVSATLYKTTYNPRPQLLSQTFTSSTTAIHASKKMIELMTKEGFFGKEGKNMRFYRLFTEKFEQIRKRTGNIQGPYGLGGMIAFTPFDGNREKVIAFGKDLFTAGVISFICGKDPTRIRFLIPVGCLTEKDIDEALEIVLETLVKS